jgi:hypothetical protein
VIDRALGTMRDRRRRRTAAGGAAVLATAVAIALPLTLTGASTVPITAGTPARYCWTVAPDMSTSALGPTGTAILSHLPDGYVADDEYRTEVCGTWGDVPTLPLDPVRMYNVTEARPDGMTVLMLVLRADVMPVTFANSLPTFTEPACAHALQSLATFGRSGEATTTGGGPAPEATMTMTWPDPSGLSSDTPTPPPISGDVTPSSPATPGAALVPHSQFCHKATATSPLVLGWRTVWATIVVSIGRDGRAIFAQLTRAPAGSPTAPITQKQLIALVTDPTLLAQLAQG